MAMASVNTRVLIEHHDSCYSKDALNAVSNNTVYEKLTRARRHTTELIKSIVSDGCDDEVMQISIGFLDFVFRFINEKKKMMFWKQDLLLVSGEVVE
jgi:hypothetical protein